MSFIVMLIGAAHAAPSLLGAVIIKSKMGVVIGTVIGTLIAFASGNPTFIAADLFGVGLGAWLGLAIVGKTPQK
jgi:hypothetical protein